MLVVYYIRFQASYLGACALTRSFFSNGGLLGCLQFQPRNSTILATRMALVGQMGGQDVDGKEDIASYIERIELYFAANYVEKDNEVVTLLAVIGVDVYGVLRNLLALKRPKDKPFDELKEVVIGHYSSKPISVLNFIVATSLRSNRLLSLWWS